MAHAWCDPVTRDELEGWSTRILQCWPKCNIPPQEWEDALRNHDAGAVGTAFIRLRDNEKYPPSIAEFVAAIRSLGPTGPRRDGVDCTRCGGDGLNTRQQTVHDHTYEVLVPCLCENGTEAAEMLARMSEANEAESRRVFRRPRPVADSQPRPLDHALRHGT